MGMQQSPEELHKTLLNTGSISIKETILIEKGYNKYSVVSKNEEGETVRIFQTRDVPDVTDIQVYIDSINTVESWDTNGYHDVGEWEHVEQKSSHDWRTPEDNYVRLSNSRSYLSFTAQRKAKLFIDDLLGASSSDMKVKLSLAIYLHSTPARQFDYLYAKYNSMHNNLTDVYGIGNEVADELLEDKDCETYKDAEHVLWRTDLPKMYVSDAKEELKEHINNGKENLFDQSVQKEYSDVIVASNV